MEPDQADDHLTKIQTIIADFRIMAGEIQRVDVEGTEESIIEMEEILIKLFAKRWRELRQISGSIEWTSEMPYYFCGVKPCKK